MKKVAFIFPGQGSQSVGMGKDFYENEPLAKELFEQAGDRLNIDFKNLCFEQNELLEKTEYTQPAILLVSLVALALFQKKCDIKPTVSLGHSLGEFGALVSAGALDALDGVELVRHRGAFMQEASDGKSVGMMVLLGLSDDGAEIVCERKRGEGAKIWCANFNQDGQIVIAGMKDDLKSAEADFLSAGAKRAMLLNMSVASHCPILESAQAPLKDKLTPLLKDSFSPVVSNVSAQKYSTKTEALELLPKQLISPVLYKHSIKNIENEVDYFVEFGGSVLKGINKKITEKPTLSVTDMKSLNEALEYLSQ